MSNASRENPFAWLTLEQAGMVVDSLRGEPATDAAAPPCAYLTGEEQQRYLAGTADAAAALRVATHLGECDACRRAMSQALQARDADAAGAAAPTMGRGQLDALLSALQPRVDVPERTPAANEATRSGDGQDGGA